MHRLQPQYDTSVQKEKLETATGYLVELSELTIRSSKLFSCLLFAEGQNICKSFSSREQICGVYLKVGKACDNGDDDPLDNDDDGPVELRRSQQYYLA